MGGLIEALGMLSIASLFTWMVLDGFHSGSSIWWLVPMARGARPYWFWVGQLLGALSALVFWVAFFSALAR